MLITPTKKCYKCKEIKEIDQFRKDSRFEDGAQYYCRSCQKMRSRELSSLPPERLPSATKVCTDCKIAKPSNEFSKNNQTKDGIARQCKDCSKNRMKVYINLPKEIPSPIKKCEDCELNKTPEEFSKHLSGKDGLRDTCKICNRKNKLKKKYGIDSKDYDAMLRKQDGLCAICKKPETSVRSGKFLLLAVDHCHKTGRVRGLLCSACNRGLGLFYDNPFSLDTAAKYLRGSM